MLDVNNITVNYGDIPALNNVSLNVSSSDVVCLLGPNGAGKSTLIKTISGQVKPVNGEILFKGKRLNDMPPSQIVREGIVQCPEGRHIFTTLTVRENVLVATSRFKTGLSDFKKELDFIFQLFPLLKERWNQDAGTLSGGEQQMLSIARGIIARPNLLLLDEPSLGLAPILVDKLFKAIFQIAEIGIPIILVEQNVYAALRVARRGYIVKDGGVIYEGDSQNIRKHLNENSGVLN